jgi:hypothetical protein
MKKLIDTNTTMKQLVNIYNGLVDGILLHGPALDVKRTNRFSSKEAGIKRIEYLCNMIEKNAAAKIEKVEPTKVEKVKPAKVKKVKPTKVEKVEPAKVEKNTNDVLGGRKQQVLTLLKGNRAGIEIDFMARYLGISNRNVSSILTYLRKDHNYVIHTKRNSETRQFIATLKN